MNRIAATMHTPRRAARVLLPLALAGVLLASPVLGHAMSRASAGTHQWRSVVLLNADGTSLLPITLLSAPFHTMAPVTMVWKVASANAAGIRSHFAVALLDAQGRTRARLADTTRPGLASYTMRLADCNNSCALRISVANMKYALVGYTLALPR